MVLLWYTIKNGILHEDWIFLLAAIMIGLGMLSTVLIQMASYKVCFGHMWIYYSLHVSGSFFLDAWLLSAQSSRRVIW